MEWQAAEEEASAAAAEEGRGSDDAEGEYEEWDAPIGEAPSAEAVELKEAVDVLQQLVEEKRRALEAAAPKVSLQQYLLSGNAALQRHAEELLAAAPLPPAVHAEVGAIPDGAAAAGRDGGVARREGGDEAPDGSVAAPSPDLALPHGASDAGGSSAISSLHRSSEAAQIRAMRLQQELLLREMEECTFQPRTNLAHPTTKVANTDFFERSYKWREERLQQQEARRRQLEGERMQECTFKPAIQPHGKGARASEGSLVSTRSVDVVSRLYQPQARVALHEEHCRQREARAAEEAKECSFKPRTTKPSRTNQATDVRSRYWRPSPQRSRPLPTGEEHCTFSPRVNSTPRSLSPSVSNYLGESAHHRLSRHPSSAVPASPSPCTLTRSASAPRERMASRHGSAATSVETSVAGSEASHASGFEDFLERQQQHAQRKLEAQQRLAEQIESGYAPKPPSAPRASTGSEEARRPFLERVAQSVEKMRQSSRTGENSPPSHEAGECTFHPQINAAARQRKSRSVWELSAGDSQRQSRMLELKRAAAAHESEAGLTFKPAINTVPGVNSRLKVASEPESYLARVRQHMKLKERVTEVVREAEENKQMEECTFHPRTHEAPAYITRIAHSMKLARSAQPPPPPSKPDWR